MKITKEEYRIKDDKKPKDIADLIRAPYKEGDSQFGWMLRTYGNMIKNSPEIFKMMYIDPLIALGKATIRQPRLVKPAHKQGRRSAYRVPKSHLLWFFDDPKYGTAGQGYLPIWHYIPRKGFVDAHEGAKYHGLLDGVNAVDQDVLDKSNRDLQNIIRALQKSREKRMQKENKTMKITKKELANIIKEEVEKALGDNPKKQYDILKSFDEKRKEFNKKIGVKNRVDYYYKLGVAGPSSKKPDKYSPKGYHSIPDMGKFKEAKRKYQDAVSHYVRTGEVRNPLK